LALKWTANSTIYLSKVELWTGFSPGLVSLGYSNIGWEERVFIVRDGELNLTGCPDSPSCKRPNGADDPTADCAGFVCDPGVIAAQGTWALRDAVEWQGAELDAAVRVEGGSSIYIVWMARGMEQSPRASCSGGGCALILP